MDGPRAVLSLVHCRLGEERAEVRVTRASHREGQLAAEGRHHASAVRQGRQAGLHAVVVLGVGREAEGGDDGQGGREGHGGEGAEGAGAGAHTRAPEGASQADAYLGAPRSEPAVTAGAHCYAVRAKPASATCGRHHSAPCAEPADAADTEACCETCCDDAGEAACETSEEVMLTFIGMRAHVASVTILTGILRDYCLFHVLLCQCVL